MSQKAELPARPPVVATAQQETADKPTKATPSSVFVQHALNAALGDTKTPQKITVTAVTEKTKPPPQPKAVP